MTTNNANTHEKIERMPYAIITAELLFVLLPFIVISIISIYKGEASQILFIPEWSLASAILSGQTIVKLISGLLAKPEERQWEKVSLVITLLIVLLLVPSLIVLTLVMMTRSPSLILVIFQLLLFIASVLMFYLFGGMGEELL